MVAISIRIDAHTYYMDFAHDVSGIYGAPS